MKKLRFRTQVLRIIVLLAAISGVMFVFSSAIANHILLHPTQNPIAHDADVHRIPHGAGFLEILQTSSSSGREAHESSLVVVALTGNAGRAEWMVRYTQSLFSESLPGVWIDVFALQWPGYGGSSGPTSLEALAPAARATVQFAKQQCPDRPLIVHGLSLGTTAALAVEADCADEGTRAALLLEKPPELQTQINAQGWWNLWLLALPIASAIPSSAQSEPLAASATLPAVIVGAEHDRIVPQRFSRIVHDAYAGPKRWITMQGGHNDPLTPESCPDARVALRWLLDGISD